MHNGHFQHFIHEVFNEWQASQGVDHFDGQSRDDARPEETLPQQTQNAAKVSAQHAPQVAAGDSDGDSDGSGGASVPTAGGTGGKVNISA